MGRRKQANPIRVGLDESVLATSSKSPSTTTTSSSASLPSITPPPSKLSPTNKHNGITINGGPTVAKKPKTDFSIKSHLEAKSTNSSSSSSFNPSLSPQSLSNALKAYETLLNELNRQPNGLKPGPLLQLTKQVDKLSSKDGKRDPATETALDLRVKKPSSLPAPTSTPKKLSTAQTDNSDSLKKLSTLVGKAGTSMNASMAAVVKSPTNFIKDDNDPCKIFTCLQCFERFPGMTELVEHMSKTKHHFNQTIPNTKPSSTTTNGFLDPHSLLRQTLLSSQKI